ncbi:MAG: hypothetical protein HC806_09915 [Anaerolineae bacterium]|nr:hypothetical protein [Anaerolineae bacterium]
MQANTIDEVISMLDEIIARSRREGSRLGYFPALYRKVTIKVKEGIQQGVFEDNPRMEKLDVIFANRYIEAIHQYWRGEKMTQAWELSFSAGKENSPIVLQHLLLGMNAHINLDLGISAALTCPGDELPSLHTDFNKINEILASLVNGVKDEMTQIWPLLGPLERVVGITEDVMINFSMEKARDQAWRTAKKIAPLTKEQQDIEIPKIDQWVGEFGKVVLKPPLRTVRFSSHWFVLENGKLFKKPSIY